MPQISIFLHKSIQEHAELIATVVDTSRSEIISDCVRYVKDNELEEDVWEGYDDKLEALEEKLEAESEEEEEEEEEE